MKEAKKRNPQIIFEALPFNFPGWIGDQEKISGDPNAPWMRYARVFTEEGRRYLVSFLDLAKAQGTPIS